jgi:hypothetical protein
VDHQSRRAILDRFARVLGTRCTPLALASTGCQVLQAFPLIIAQLVAIPKFLG